MTRKNYVLKIIDDKNKLSERILETNIHFNNKILISAIKEVRDTLHNNPYLTVLAAPQLGKQLRFFCMKFAGGDIRTFINPIIMKSKGLHLSREICPSIPGKEFIVPRNDEITVAYQTPVGNNESNIFKGAPAEMFQQMVNLLDGVLIDDFGLEVLEGFDDLSNEDREEILNLYIDSLKEYNIILQKEIEEDEELKEIKRATDFLTSVALGETTLDKEEEIVTTDEINIKSEIEVE